MLTCYGHSCQLPQGELTYLAFRLALLDTFEEILICRDSRDEPDTAAGFMVYVPILAEVPAAVQIDLLAEVWSRQRAAALTAANLLDAAVVYAVCEDAARIIRDEPEIARLYLRDGPRKIKTKLTRRTAERLEQLFDNFWDDVDFLTLSDWQDMDAEHVAALKHLMRIPDDQPLYDALARGQVSPRLAANLEGLLTAQEIEEVVGGFGVA